MKKNAKLTKRLVFLFTTTAFCALAAVGCGANTGAEGNQKYEGSADNDSKEVSLEPTEENQENDSSADDGYVADYPDEDVSGDTQTEADVAGHKVEVPNYMQPDTVMIYDENLDYTFEQGGEDADASNEGSGVYAYPGMKAVYDDDGLLRNVYYPVPGEPGSYQLSAPADADSIYVDD